MSITTHEDIILGERERVIKISVREWSERTIVRFPWTMPRLCIFLRPRAISNNWRRGDEGMGGDRRDKGRAYQLQPSNALVVPQIPSEVKTIHECENEGKWVL